jgi:hypothetical protein
MSNGGRGSCCQGQHAHRRLGKKGRRTGVEKTGQVEKKTEKKKGTLVIDSFVPSCEDILPNWITKTAQFHKKSCL